MILQDGLIYNFKIICSDMDTYQNDYNPNRQWSGDGLDWVGMDWILMDSFRLNSIELFEAG